MKSPVLIYGSKDFSRTVAELARHCKIEVAGYIDDFDNGPDIVGTLDQAADTHPPSKYRIAVAIGYNSLNGRWRAWDRARGLGYEAATLVHPRAYVADSAAIGPGAMIMAGAIVDVRASIGSLAVLWPGACVNHDAIIGANSFLSPGVIVCGHVTLGHSVLVGAGAVISDHQDVPTTTFIKAASLYFRRPE